MKNNEYVRFLLPRGAIVYLDETREVLEKDYYTTLKLNKTSQKLYHIARRNLQQQIARELHGINPRMISIDSRDFKYQVQPKIIK